MRRRNMGATTMTIGALAKPQKISGDENASRTATSPLSFRALSWRSRR
jgi:hypothetical protein